MDTRNMALAAFVFGAVMLVGTLNYLGGKAQGRREANAEWVHASAGAVSACDWVKRRPAN